MKSEEAGEFEITISHSQLFVASSSIAERCSVKRVDIDQIDTSILGILGKSSVLVVIATKTLHLPVCYYLLSKYQCIRKSSHFRVVLGVYIILE